MGACLVSLRSDHIRLESYASIAVHDGDAQTLLRKVGSDFRDFIRSADQFSNGAIAQLFCVRGNTSGNSSVSSASPGCRRSSSPGNGGEVSPDRFA